MFVRVRDPETKHQFDVPKGDPRIADGRLVPMSENRWPPSNVIRPPKHHIKLAGRTASRETDSAPVESEPQDAPAPVDEATEKE